MVATNELIREVGGLICEVAEGGVSFRSDGCVTVFPEFMEKLAKAGYSYAKTADQVSLLYRVHSGALSRERFTQSQKGLLTQNAVKNMKDALVSIRGAKQALAQQTLPLFAKATSSPSPSRQAAKPAQKGENDFTYPSETADVEGMFVFGTWNLKQFPKIIPNDSLRLKNIAETIKQCRFDLLAVQEVYDGSLTAICRYLNEKGILGREWFGIESYRTGNNQECAGFIWSKKANHFKVEREDLVDWDPKMQGTELKTEAVPRSKNAVSPLIRKPYYAKFRFNDRRCYIINVHLSSQEASREVSAHALDIVNRLRKGQEDFKGLVILCGDFNLDPSRADWASLTDQGWTHQIRMTPTNTLATSIYDNILVLGKNMGDLKAECLQAGVAPLPNKSTIVREYSDHRAVWAVFNVKSVPVASTSNTSALSALGRLSLK